MKFFFLIFCFFVLVQNNYAETIKNIDKKLCRTIVDGDYKRARWLIKMGAKINKLSCSSSGISPLSFAAWKGRTDFCKLLIEKGADINTVIKPSGYTPLLYAARYGHKETVLFLLKKGASTGIETSWKMNFAHALCNGGLLYLLKNQLKNKKDLLVKDSEGRTSLHYASWGGDTDVIEFLLTMGLDPNSKDNYKKTPLYYAVDHNRTGAVKFLLNHGAVINKPYKFLFNTVDLVEKYDLLEFLLGYYKKKNINYKKYLDDLLMEASRYAFYRSTKLLIEYGADVNYVSSRNIRPLHIVNHENNLEISMSPDNQFAVLKLLIKKGAKPNVKDSYGKTPLHWAVTIRNLKNAQYLLEHNADPDLKNRWGTTAIHIAVKNNNTDIIRLLLKHNADVSIKNVKGEKPIELTKDEEVRILLKQSERNKKVR